MSGSPMRPLIAALAIVLAACGPGSTAPPTASDPPPASPSLATQAPSAAPLGSAIGSPRTAPVPPDASLAAEGGDPVVGQLGSFTWGDGGSDSPWLPGAAIAVGAGEPLSVTLADTTPVGSWRAVRAPAGSTTGAGAIATGEGSGRIGFAIAEPGRWTVAVTIGFLDGGSATWYWQLDVT